MADSPREACFKEAMDAYQSATDKNLGVDWKKQWLWNGSKYEKSTMWRSFNRMLGRIRRGFRDAEPGAPTAWREPDITVGDRVADLKFDGDTFDNPRLGRDGKTQRDAYDSINQQADGKKKTDVLDKDTCQCKQRANAKGEPVPAEVTQPAFDGLNFYGPEDLGTGRLPGRVPLPGRMPLPGRIPLRLPPIRIPFPIIP